MKLVILAGGYGSRLSKKQFETKPLIEIGGKPIIWHIMKIYSFYGVNDFMILCVGIKEIDSKNILLIILNIIQT